MNQNICIAIENRYVLRVIYGGERVIEPHCYGVSPGGNELLRAFQTSGYSESGESFGWKLFRMDKMGSIEGTGETFAGPRPGYNPVGDQAMATIYCKL